MLDLPLVDKNAGFTPCVFFNFLPKFDKIAVLTPCVFFSILGLQIDENARVLQLFVKFDKNAFLVNFGFK